MSVFSAECQAKKLRNPPDFFYRLLKVSLRVQNSTVPEGRGLIRSSILDCGMKWNQTLATKLRLAFVNIRNTAKVINKNAHAGMNK